MVSKPKILQRFYQRNRAIPVKEDMKRLIKNVEHVFDVWQATHDANYIILYGKEK